MFRNGHCVTVFRNVQHAVFSRSSSSIRRETARGSYPSAGAYVENLLRLASGNEG